MKIIKLEQHARNCNPTDWYGYKEKIWLCEMNPERFLFFLNNNFYLIIYHKCIEYFNEYEFKISLIKQALDGMKLKYNIVRKHGLNYASKSSHFKFDEGLRDVRKKGIFEKSSINEVNYIYSDASGFEYCLTTERPYIESIINNSNTDESYEKAKQALKDSANEFMLDKLEYLYEENKFYISEVEIVKTIDVMINNISKQLKTNKL